MERERVKEPDADQISDYEKSVRHYQEWADRQKTGELLIRGDKRDYQVSRQGFIKYYMNPLTIDTALSSWAVFEHLIKNQSGRHKHQGGIIIYALEGQGATENDGELLEWPAGDLLLLPIKPGGCVHQHWNRDTSKGCRWVAFHDVMTLPIFPNGVVYRHVNTGAAPVRLICIERNLVHTTGVDRQSSFEELQPCPEYRQAQSA